MITCHNIFTVGPKTTLLLPVWPRDAQRLATPVSDLISTTSQGEARTRLT